MSKGDNDKYTLHDYALLLRDWHKFADSHTILKGLLEQYPDNNLIRKSLEFTEKVMKEDYIKTKEDLKRERAMREEILKEHMAQLISLTSPSNPTIPFRDVVLGAIEKIGADIEEKASTYAGLPEDSIRDIFHGYLNIETDGRATRETMGRIGYTDIHISDPNNPSNIIVIEFKLWNGEVYYHKGIRQLLGYMTNRHRECIFVTLNRTPNWKQVVLRAREASKTYPGYVKDSVSPISFENHNTAFQTEIEDSNRTEPLKVYHILFNLYSDKEN